MEYNKIKVDTLVDGFNYFEIMQGYTFKLQIDFYENGLPIDLENKNINIELLKSDGKIILQNNGYELLTNVIEFNQATKTKNVSIKNGILITAHEDFTRISGRSKMQIVLTDKTDNKVTGSWIIDINIKQSAISDNKGESENIATILEQVRSEINNADNTKNDLKDYNDELSRLISENGVVTNEEFADLFVQNSAYLTGRINDNASDINKNKQEITKVKNDITINTTAINKNISDISNSNSKITNLENEMNKFNIVATDTDGILAFPKDYFLRFYSDYFTIDPGTYPYGRDVTFPEKFYKVFSVMVCGRRIGSDIFGLPNPYFWNASNNGFSFTGTMQTGKGYAIQVLVIGY